MRYLIVLILLAFPVAEFGLLAKLAESHGWGLVAAWVILAAALGVALIKQARFALLARVAEALAEGNFSLAAFIDSARAVFAGLLLIFPGILSDILALILLLLPQSTAQLELPESAVAERGAAQRGNVIDGEFRRER